MTRILVAENDQRTRRTVRRVLEGEGVEIIECTNGWSAYVVAALRQPDVILLDVSIPVLNGFEVAEMLKRNLETALIPVIMLSGRSAPEEALRSMEVGALECLTPPCRPTDLKNSVRMALDNHRSTTSSIGAAVAAWGRC
jgi:putative two-component system response regulator